MTARKRDRDGNPVGHANDNPILDTRSYIVDIDDGDQTELTANKIAESLYSQCDPDGNHYVLLEEIVDYQRLPTAVKLSDQKTVRANGKTYQSKTIREYKYYKRVQFSCTYCSYAHFISFLRLWTIGGNVT